MSKSLVVGSGAMYGAYGAGVCAELARQLGSEYFDSVYASSVGVFAATFFVAGQPHVIESTWRGHVDGRKLINLFRVWRTLKLHYLEEIFQDERSFLDVEAVFRSRTCLTYVLTRISDGSAVYRSPSRHDIFRSMSASSATPMLHGAVQLGSDRFFDGAFSDPLPVGKALESGTKLVVVVNNKRRDFRIARSFHLLGLACRFVSGTVARLIHNYEARVQETHRLLADSRVLVIRPSSPVPLRRAIDTNTARLNATIDLGIRDARKAIDELDKRC